MSLGVRDGPYVTLLCGADVVHAPNQPAYSDFLDQVAVELRRGRSSIGGAGGETSDPERITPARQASTDGTAPMISGRLGSPLQLAGAVLQGMLALGGGAQH